MLESFVDVAMMSFRKEEEGEEEEKRIGSFEEFYNFNFTSHFNNLECYPTDE